MLRESAFFWTSLRQIISKQQLVVPHASDKTTKTVHWPPGPWGLNPPGWPLKGNGFPFVPPIGICGDWPPNGEFPNGFVFWPGLGKPANRDAHWYFSQTVHLVKETFRNYEYTQIKLIRFVFLNTDPPLPEILCSSSPSLVIFFANFLGDTRKLEKDPLTTSKNNDVFLMLRYFFNQAIRKR